jgi:thioredoxin 1
VLFTAEWCPFCRQFEPIFQSAKESSDFKKGVVDLTDEENPLWEVFDVRVVPTIVVFREGNQVLRKDGVLGRGLPVDTMARLMKEIETS